MHIFLLPMNIYCFPFPGYLFYFLIKSSLLLVTSGSSCQWLSVMFYFVFIIKFNFFLISGASKVPAVKCFGVCRNRFFFFSSHQNLFSRVMNVLICHIVFIH